MHPCAGENGDTAVLHACRSADAIEAAARAGVQLDGLSRARVRSDVATVAVCCREAVGLLLDVGIEPQVTPTV